MLTNNLFNFEYSYLSLPSKFYSLVKPTSLANPELVLLNAVLLDELNIASGKTKDEISVSFRKELSNYPNSYAQAYAGHQFGHFTRLGDGRAIIIGEHVCDNNERFDIQLKGSGRTIFSRGGDGKATLRAMLREYLMSEAMHYLNIPSSRSLAVLKTGEEIYRETIHEGATVVRVMKSHIRIGTFEYARHAGTTDDLRALTQYTIKRLYPEIEHDENPALSLLRKVLELQIELVVNWMRVGFIHGVMNTDNTSISGETFDYGPCAFMNTYHPDTVFSSIDQKGRYAFSNQAGIIKWNLSRFAETLLPIIHENIEKSVELAQSVINGFEKIWYKKYYGTMLNKIGIERNDPEHYVLVDELLELMKNLELDYTNTFLALAQDIDLDDNPTHRSEFKPWLEKWKDTIDQSIGMIRAKQLMETHNPVFIPRNHLVEQALNEAAEGNFTLFERLLGVLSNPYQHQPNENLFMMPADLSFERNYRTFCGT